VALIVGFFALLAFYRNYEYRNMARESREKAEEAWRNARSRNTPSSAASPPPASSDEQLRAFSGLMSIKGRYTFSPADRFYALTTLCFEDGRLVRIGGISTGPVHAPEFDGEVIWGMFEGKPRMTLSTPGTQANEDGAFWMKLDGARSGIYPSATFDGYTILAMAQSRLEQDGNPQNRYSSAFDETVKQKKYVGALALRTFATEQELNAFMNSVNDSPEFQGHPTPQLSTLSQTGEELRTFLGVKSIRGKFKLPKDAVGYYPVALFFADGKQVARAPSVMFFGDPTEGEIQLLWQMDDTRKSVKRAALVDGGNERDVFGFYSHWDEFRNNGARTVPPDEHFRYGDVDVAAIIGTQGSGSFLPQLYPAPDQLPTAAKYVIAIGVVTDSDRDRLRTKFERDQIRDSPFESRAIVQCCIRPQVGALQTSPDLKPATLYLRSDGFREALERRAKLPPGSCTVKIGELKNSDLLTIGIASNSREKTDALTNALKPVLADHDKSGKTFFVIWEISDTEASPGGA
jgi:hypothetical protein